MLSRKGDIKMISGHILGGVKYIYIKMQGSTYKCKNWKSVKELKLNAFIENLGISHCIYTQVVLKIEHNLHPMKS